MYFNCETHKKKNKKIKSRRNKKKTSATRSTHTEVTLKYKMCVPGIPKHRRSVRDTEPKYCWLNMIFICVVSPTEFLWLSSLLFNLCLKKKSFQVRFNLLFLRKHNNNRQSFEKYSLPFLKLDDLEQEKNGNVDNLKLLCLLDLIKQSKAKQKQSIRTHSICNTFIFQLLQLLLDWLWWQTQIQASLNFE